jgi:peptidyl-dipeptidase Dcp
VLKAEQDWALELDDAHLDGLPDFLVETARREGTRRGSNRGVITLSRSSIEPFLTFSPDRGLRETAWRAWTDRGEATNWPVIDEILALRLERARLLGFDTFADYKLTDQMAKTPAAVRDLLLRVLKPAKARAAQEAADLVALSELEAGAALEPWDWRYLAEKQRRRLHDLDEAELKPYLPLEGMINAAFAVSARLFGLSYTPVRDVPLPHPDARAWEVHRDGAPVGLFVADYFARPSKRSGAWASALQAQQKLWSPGLPIVLNTMNFAQGDPTLLSFDDARTLFHEFGHALHGLLSDVTHPSISGTAVARDFVELPSQLFEHWLSVPEVLAEHARHYRTGEPIPPGLVAKLHAAEAFNQGCQTLEYLSSALVDLEMHSLQDTTALDARALERQILDMLDLPRAIAMRHRSPHFLHVFAGDGYSAGYYSYMWSEVMDADAFMAFEETGDVFDPETAARLAEHVLSAGGREEPDAAYIAFRGRLPGVEALLKGRGLLEVEAAA